MLRNYAVVVGAEEMVVGFGASEQQAWEDARAQGVDLDRARLVDFDADRFIPSFIDGVTRIAPRSAWPSAGETMTARSARSGQRSRSSTA